MGMEISSQRLQEADSRAQSSQDAPECSCDAASQARFERALKQGTEKDGEPFSNDGQADADTDAWGKAGGTDKLETASLSPSALMESLFGARMTTAGESATGSVGPGEAANMGEMVDRLVERILVSEPGKGNPEVRITLGDGALSGTELSLSRAPDGQLAVRLSCSAFAAFQTAVEAQDSLRAALERSGENVRVEVVRSGESDGTAGGNEGDSQRRSAMYGIVPDTAD